jgi:ribonuclease III
VTAAAPQADDDLGAAALELRIGHRFADPALLGEALTHSSAVGAARRTRRSNERLEFLGDRVLNLVIADLLMTRFPRESEGSLSKRHAGLVRRETLAEIGRELELGRWLELGRSELDGGGEANPAILADALEALIGALYRDGGLAVAEDFIRRRWRSRLHEMRKPPRDAKTSLQEWAQARGLGLPSYSVVGTAGPPHAPHFEVMVALADLPPAQAGAGSKRAAEQAAARELLSSVAPGDD